MLDLKPKRERKQSGKITRWTEAEEAPLRLTLTLALALALALTLTLTLTLFLTRTRTQTLARTLALSRCMRHAARPRQWHGTRGGERDCRW